MNNPFKKLWFWLLILSIIGFITAFVLFERLGQTNTGNNTTPGWIWIVFLVSFILWIVALGFYVADAYAYNKKLEIDKACGLIKEKPQKIIECPKKECIEKKVVECKDTNVKYYNNNVPCNNVKYYDNIVSDNTYSLNNEIYSKNGQIRAEGPFSAKPLSTLAPS